MTPDEGYVIDQVKVDGQTVDLKGIVADDGTGSYTFENIDEDHTIEVTFKKGETPVKPGDDEGQGGSKGEQSQGGLPTTGDYAGIIAGAVAVIGAGSAAAGVALKRRKNR